MMYKADANESPYGLPAQCMARLTARIAENGLNRYPPNHDEAKAAVARYVGLEPQNIVCGNGSDELIAMTVLAVARGGLIAVAPPTFGMYAECAINYGGEVAELPAAPDLSVDVDRYIAFAKESGARLAVLCNPNNPTGLLIPREGVGRLIREFEGVVVLDEAYVEFSGGSCIDLVGKYDNLVVLRTLSKAFGMAGLRFGYLAAGSGLARRIEALRPIYNLGVVPLMGAAEALSDTGYMLSNVERLTAERQRMERRLSSLKNIESFRSATNFMLFRSKRVDIAARLAEAGVASRTYPDEVLAGCVRVTVGEEGQNDIVMKVLEDCDEKG